ncbi:DUF2207 domain-containing protein [Patescibacteria group bacterium]|nr:DUF2207 domain-containing protein [Patescibacteria group bacterium]
MQKICLLLGIMAVISGCVAQKPEEEVAKQEWYFEDFSLEVEIQEDLSANFKEEQDVVFRGDFDEYVRKIPKSYLSGSETQSSFAVYDNKNQILSADDYEVRETADNFEIAIPLSTELDSEKRKVWTIEYQIKNIIEKKGNENVLKWSVIPFPRTGGAKSVRAVVSLGQVSSFKAETATLKINEEVNQQAVVLDKWTFLFVGENIPNTKDYVIEAVFK